MWLSPRLGLDRSTPSLQDHPCPLALPWKGSPVTPVLARAHYAHNLLIPERQIPPNAFALAFAFHPYPHAYAYAYADTPYTNWLGNKHPVAIHEHVLHTVIITTLHH